MRRRAFLAGCAAAGFAGCATFEGPTTAVSTGDRPGRSPAAGAATDTDSHPPPSPTERPATATPTESRLPTDSPTSTATATASEPLFPGYETTDVRVTTPDGETLGSVNAAIADTSSLRYTGLSDTEYLPPDRGMLFVYDEVGDHTFVMREMDFGIDIVYADDEGVITRIHHAPEPGPNEDGEDQTYPGRGQYVLELVYEWTTERGVETGDVLQFDL